MRIGIDISTLTGQLDGVNCYLLNLVEHMALLDKENEYFLYTNRTENQRIPGVGGNFKIRQSNNSHRLVWMQVQLPFLMRKDRIDVFHSPCYNTPMLSGVRQIVTVHDMSSVLFPGQFVWKHRFVYSTLVPLSMRMADGIIAVSECTRQDIIKLYKINGSKIVTIHEGVNKTFYKRDNSIVEKNRIKYKINSKYILFVGTLQPRKNLVYLIKAFSLANKKAGNIEHQLVIAGKKGWFYKDIFRIVEELNLSSRVNFPGHVPEEDLPSLYSGADLFIFPSLYEGFGLPPLEAMACGAPVIASDTSCFPEILGNSALLVDPGNAEQLADGMSRMVLDRQLHDRMVIAGRERVKHFTWEKAARETLRAYRGVQTNLIGGKEQVN